MSATDGNAEATPVTTAVTRPAATTLPQTPSRAFPAQRLFIWSVRRELWQHRAIMLAPALIGAFFVAGSLLAAFNGPEMVRQLEALPPFKRTQLLSMPLMVSAEVIRFIAFITAAAYALTAFYSERRDRSILFWKSLPVSDRIAVAAKAAIPLVVVPVIAFIAIAVTNLLTMVIGTVAFAVAGAPVSMLWADAGVGSMLAQTGAAFVFQTLWQAPIYGYLLLVSSWAARVPVLWVILGPVGAIIFESYVFGTAYIGDAIKSRFTDGFVTVLSRSERATGYQPAAVPDVVTYLTSPALWAGLVVAALFIAATVWMRRRAEPT